VLHLAGAPSIFALTVPLRVPALCVRIQQKSTDLEHKAPAKPSTLADAPPCAAHSYRWDFAFPSPNSSFVQTCGSSACVFDLRHAGAGAEKRVTAVRIFSSRVPPRHPLQPPHCASCRAWARATYFFGPAAPLFGLGAAAACVVPSCVGGWLRCSWCVGGCVGASRGLSLVLVALTGRVVVATVPPGRALPVASPMRFRRSYAAIARRLCGDAAYRNFR
jgi:hypothetical protein